MKSSALGRRSLRRSFSLPSLLPVLVLAIALLLLGIVLALGPSIISDELPALTSFHTFAAYLWVLVIGAVLFAIVIALRQDELAAILAIAVHLFVDWYLDLRIVALLMALSLLLVFFLARSPRFPWVEPRAFWLWGAFLLIAIFPAIRGALRVYDAMHYYPNDIFGALIFFWLGSVIARDVVHVRRFFMLLAGFGALLALHTIFQAATGRFLFASSHLAPYYADTTFYQLAGSDAQRLGSFFVDPNWNGTCLAMLAFIPLGLFAESSSPQGKLLYLAEAVLMALAVLFTYSAGAALATIAGVIAFAALVGCNRYRMQILLFVALAVIVLLVWFQSDLQLLLQHAEKPGEAGLRLGAWQTALRVILAFPLTGVGMGVLAYEQQAEPYRVAAQYEIIAHPHNSYLEFGAMAGLPVLIVFVALLSFALWLAFCNWRLLDVRSRAMLGGGIAAVLTLSFNSLTINGWTLPPLAAIGWLILGVISSPLLARSRNETRREENTTAAKDS